MKRDFLKLSDLTLAEHGLIFARSAELKALRRQGDVVRSLTGRTVALLMEKASTRTRMSFEAAMVQLGGHALNLSVSESQLARGEPLSDTARVLSGYVDAIVFRTFGDERMETLARAATVPVINGLTDTAHPVQLLADLFTLHERFGRIEGIPVAFVGDGNSNMARSWVEAAGLFGFPLVVASPEGFQPPASEVLSADPWVSVVASPREAVGGAWVVTTDVWTSMGQEAESARRRQAFTGFCVNEELLESASRQAVVLHCLPAHRGEEISEEVLEGPRSLVFEEAENRMHVQKALLELLLAPMSLSRVQSEEQVLAAS